jgi:hypothetical protein
MAPATQSTSSGTTPTVALITAAGSIVVALIALVGTILVARKQTSVQRDLAAKAEKLAEGMATQSRNHQEEMAAWSHKLQRELAAAAQNHVSGENALSRGQIKAIEETKFAIEGQKIDLEYQKLLSATDKSSLEQRAMTLKTLHDRRAEETRLIHLFFDKLVSRSETERGLALFALSAAIDHEVLEQLALVVEEVSLKTDSQQTAQGEDEVENQPDGSEERPSKTTPTSASGAPPPAANAPSLRKIIGYTKGPYVLPIREGDLPDVELQRLLASNDITAAKPEK